MLIPVLSSFIAGERPLAAKLTTQTKTAIESAVYFKPFCFIYGSAVQSQTNNTVIAVDYNTAEEDTDGMADLTGNAIVIQTAGRYNVGFQQTWASNSSGYRTAQVNLNGLPFVVLTEAPANGSATRLGTCTSVRCNVGDQITVQSFHASGVALNTDTTGRGCFLWAEWTSK